MQNLPVGTPDEREQTLAALENIIRVRGGAIEGLAGAPSGGIAAGGAAINAALIVRHLTEGEYGAATQAFIGFTGDSATVLGQLLSAELTGASALSGAAMARQTLAMVGEALGPLALAGAILYETFMKPVNNEENISHIFMLQDYSGILAS